MPDNNLDDTMNLCSVYFDQNHDTSFMATATHSQWVHYGTGAGVPTNFAEYTEGNRVSAHPGGKDYFTALLAAFRQAQKSIYIAGWQVNWDAQLAEGVRLVDALLEAVTASEQLQVYIMPWDNSRFLQTYARATERVFAALNSHIKRKPFYVLRAGSKSGSFFSHHQKCVIVDERLAFVGGIDLAYGRYDDNYGLKADAAGRQGMNMYNPCIPQMAKGTGYNPMEEYAMPTQHPQWDQHPKAKAQAKSREDASVARIIEVVLAHQLSQSPGASQKSAYLDPAIQPRMPWQDYQIEIEGPAVYELVRNFVLRWNSYSSQYPRTALQTRSPKLNMPAVTPEKVGSSQVQVLRSASLKMCKDEFKAMPASTRQPTGIQNDILRSIQLLIGKAEHYIYIENQFFISAFGESSVKDVNALSPVADSINPSLVSWATRIPRDVDAPQNPVAEWLGDKIKRVIFAYRPEPFHIYIMLPVYPEGRLDDPTIVAQIHLTRQSLVFGSHSLLNRIRRSLWVRQQLEKAQVPRNKWHRRIPELEKACDDGYLQINIEACYEFVTLLNLRDHGELSGMPVTEQIYVHSKLMIVDDRWVLVGSANINDRSLLGNGDSELAVMIADTAHSVQDIDGTGTPAPCRHFARALRQQAWRKWLGSAAAECAEALDKPAQKASWEKIQAIAKQNTNIYDSVFNFIPRNSYISEDSAEYGFADNDSHNPKNNDVFASIWPVLPANQTNKPSDSKNMPFSEYFWEIYRERVFQNRKKLYEIKGFFTLLPVNWTAGEDNLIPYNTRLIASADNPENNDQQLAENRADNNKNGDVS